MSVSQELSWRLRTTSAVGSCLLETPVFYKLRQGHLVMNDARDTGGPGLGLVGRFLERRPCEDPLCKRRTRQQPDSCLVNYTLSLSVMSSWMPWKGINKAVLLLEGNTLTLVEAAAVALLIFSIFSLQRELTPQ